jgi:hypothetical protein
MFLNNEYGCTKNCRILCWFYICWNGIENVLYKAMGKNLCEIWAFQILQFFEWFLHVTFVYNIFWAHFNEFGICIKFSFFLNPILHIWRGGGRISTILNFNCMCSKPETFSNILLKVKSYFLQISSNLSLNPIKFWILKAHAVYTVKFYCTVQILAVAFIMIEAIPLCPIPSHARQEVERGLSSRLCLLCGPDSNQRIIGMLVQYRTAGDKVTQ